MPFLSKYLYNKTNTKYNFLFNLTTRTLFIFLIKNQKSQIVNLL